MTVPLFTHENHIPENHVGWRNKESSGRSHYPEPGPPDPAYVTKPDRVLDDPRTILTLILEILGMVFLVFLSVIWLCAQ